MGSQPSIAGISSNLDDTDAALREILAASFAHVELEAVGSIAILAASFAHVEPEAVGSIAIFAAAAPRARSSKPSDTLGWNVAGP